MDKQPVTAPIARPNFKRGLLRAVSGYRGLYQYTGQAGYYIRPVVDRRQVIHKLKAATISRAEIERGKLISQLAQYHAGLAKNPFLPSTAQTLQDLVRFYIEQGCPCKSPARIRAGQQLRDEIAQARRIAKWPGARGPAQDLTPEHWHTYAQWRKKNISEGRSGDRQIDKERITLSNVFRTAVRHALKTGIRQNLMNRDLERYRDPAQVIHCRDNMPRSGDELHRLARHCFESGPRTEVLGWFILVQSITGLRSAEVVKLRAPNCVNHTVSGHYPGELAGRKFYLPRSKTHKGTASHVDLFQEELQCLQAAQEWHQRRFPQSAWLLPSPENPALPIGKTALTHRLATITKALSLPKRTSHGLRAFRVNVLRGRGLSDAEIALKIGQKSGGKLIVEVYGEGLDYKLDWLPATGSPAHAYFQEDKNPRPVQLEMGF